MSGVNSVTFARDGQTLASGDEVGEARMMTEHSRLHATSIRAWLDARAE